MREGFVKSAGITISGASSECYISGRFDALIEFDDGTYGIIDYKTSEAREEHAAFYSRQLSAYAYALEHPAPRARSFAPISRLGLFIVTPDRFEPNPEGELAFVNRTTWVDVPRDDAAFLSLLGEVMAVLDAPAPPPSSPECPTCNYREKMAAFS
jgi:CRISPR/Cas system-associated exonuclease Cas4 (RecB family)